MLAREVEGNTRASLSVVPTIKLDRRTGCVIDNPWVPPGRTKKHQIGPGLIHDRVEIGLLLCIAQVEPSSRVFNTAEHDHHQLEGELPTLLATANGVIKRVLKEIGDH